MTRLVILVSICAGCSSLDKLPPGTQLQSATLGVKISPNAPDGTPLVIGSHTVIITTAQPADAGPNLNRMEARAPGFHAISTVASGALGDQINSAGGPEALDKLLSRDRPETDPPASPPFRLPITRSTEK